MALEVWDSILLSKNDEKQQEECNINNIYFFLNIYNWTKLFNYELFKRHLSIFFAEAHCKFFSRDMHDYQSWQILRCSPDVEFTSDSCTWLRDVVQMYYDLSTSY